MNQQPSDPSLDLATMKQVDEACDRFERDLRGNRRPLIEEYLIDTQEPCRTALLRELIRIESDYLARNGSAQTIESYRSRFPGSDDAIRAAFGQQQTTSSRVEDITLKLTDGARDASNIETKRLGLDDGPQARRLLSDSIERFDAAWRSGDALPDLLNFLPTEEGALRRMVLFELIKVDLLHRWESSQQQLRKTLEQYTALCSDVDGDGGLPFDVVYEEYRIRKTCGDSITLDEYADHYPQFASALRHCVGDGSSAMESTMMVGHAAVNIDIKGQIDDFELKEKIGQGSFATVFRARQRSMDRIVALKISSHSSDEPKTMAQLDHSNIIRVYDQRWLPDRAMLLLYMEYAPGGTLQSVVEHAQRVPSEALSGETLVDAVDAALDQRSAPRQGASIRRRIGEMSWERAVCHLGVQLAGALHCAHGKEIIHRDIKPANILMGADLTPKLADFNISYGSQIEGATPAAYFGGSLAYMSPEQLQACDPASQRQPGDLDGRSDIYSLAMVLCELLVGRRPFADIEIDGNWLDTLSTSIEQRERGVDESVRKELTARFPGMAQILLKCLAADPDDRYASADQMQRQLELQTAPKVQALLHPSPGSWQHWVVQWPLLTIALAVLIPNIALSGLNLFYNISEIVNLASEAQQNAFYNSLTAVNTVAWGLTTLVCVYYLWPVVTGLQKVRTDSSIDLDRWVELGRKTLSMGSFAAILVFVAWEASGIVFPLVMDLRTSGDPVPGRVYAHFIVSQALHGLIVAALSFFFVTFLTVRAVYPRFIPERITQSGVEADLKRLKKRVGQYAAILGISPMLAILAIGAIGSEQNYFVLLALLGGLAFLVAIGLKPIIQADLDHLCPAVRHADDSFSADHF